jgi:hypothetical protein
MTGAGSRGLLVAVCSSPRGEAEGRNIALRKDARNSDSGSIARGAGFRLRLWPPSLGPSDALFAAEVHSFLRGGRGKVAEYSGSKLWPPASLHPRIRISLLSRVVFSPEQESVHIAAEPAAARGAWYQALQNRPTDPAAGCSRNRSAEVIFERPQPWVMQGFKSAKSAQRFVSVHSAVYKTFNVQRHLISRQRIDGFEPRRINLGVRRQLPQYESGTLGLVFRVARLLSCQRRLIQSCSRDENFCRCPGFQLLWQMIHF